MAVEVRTVARIEIGQHILRRCGSNVFDRCDACVLPRDLMVIDANIGLKCAPQDHLFALKRDRHGDKLTAQENQGRPYITSNYLGIVHS